MPSRRVEARLPNGHICSPRNCGQLHPTCISSYPPHPPHRAEAIPSAREIGLARQRTQNHRGPWKRQPCYSSMALQTEDNWKGSADLHLAKGVPRGQSSAQQSAWEQKWLRGSRAGNTVHSELRRSLPFQRPRDSGICRRCETRGEGRGKEWRGGPSWR